MLASGNYRLAMAFAVASALFWVLYTLYYVLVRNSPGALPKSYVGVRWRQLTWRQRRYWAKRSYRDMGVTPADTAIRRHTYYSGGSYGPSQFFFQAHIPDDELLRDIDEVYRVPYLSAEEKDAFERECVSLIENRRYRLETASPPGPRQAVLVVTNNTPYADSITPSDETPLAVTTTTYWDHLDG